MIDFIDVRKLGAIDNSSPTVFSNSSSAAIQSAANSNKGVLIGPGCYYIDQPIVISRPANIEMVRGWASEHKHNVVDVYRKDRTILYTDKDIDIFVIESGSVHIRGGVFDFSNVQNHNGAAFRYRPFIQIGGGPPYRETWGAYDGSATDWWVVGNRNTLNRPNNGTTCVLLDWENSPEYAYIYLHKWSGRADRVKAGFAETGGKLGQNSTWNQFDCNIWGAKKAIQTKLQNRSQFNIKFQPSFGLAESEKDDPILDLQSSSNVIKFQTVDMPLAPHAQLGYSNAKTVKSIGPNVFEFKQEIDRYMLEIHAIENGFSLYEKPLLDPTRNQAGGLMQRASCSFTASPAVSVSLFENLFRNGHGFSTVLNMPSGDVFFEIQINWPLVNVPKLRLRQLNFTLDGPNNVPTGIKSLQVRQVAAGNLILDKTFNYSASSAGAFASVRHHEVKLNPALFTDSLIVRIQGSHSAASYLMSQFYLTDDRSLYSPYVQA